MSEDYNDKLMNGKLKPGQALKATPMTEAAEEADRNRVSRVYSVRELLEGAADRAINPNRLEASCTTGHYQLDENTGGMRPGFVWVLGADTSWGKSSWCVSVADENIKLGKRVMIVSVEDPPELYGDRLLARRAKVDAHRLMKGRVEQDEKQRIAQVKASAEDSPVYMMAGLKPIEKFARELHAVIRGEAIDLIFFDYLQEFQTEKRHQDERTRFKHTSAVMRDVIRSNNKTGAILSQLTISDSSKVPNKHNIRESRDVSNAAEVIAIGFSPEEDVVKSSGKDSYGQELAPEVIFRAGDKYILLDKNKGGPAKKKIHMDWNATSACFDTVDDPEVRRIAELTGVDDSFFDNTRMGGFDD